MESYPLPRAVPHPPPEGHRVILPLPRRGDFDYGSTRRIVSCPSSNNTPFFNNLYSAGQFGCKGNRATRLLTFKLGVRINDAVGRGLEIRRTNCAVCPSEMRSRIGYFGLMSHFPTSSSPAGSCDGGVGEWIEMQI